MTPTTGTNPPAGLPGSPGSGPLPCTTSPTIVQARCSMCHASPPLFGAPMSLMGAGDFQATARDKSQKVWQAARARVEAETMPPKSATRDLDGEDRTAVWLGQSAPARGVRNHVRRRRHQDHAAEIPAQLQARHTSSPRTARDAAEGYAVPTEQNHYECFNLPVPFEKQEQAVEWAPVIGDPRVVHHGSVRREGHLQRVQPVQSASFRLGPGGMARKMPTDIGMELHQRRGANAAGGPLLQPRQLPGIKDKTGRSPSAPPRPRAPSRRA
jgi:hypothetical protein